MGKISKALDKFANERNPPQHTEASAAPPLSDDDILVLVDYDRKSGHLLKCNEATGQVDEKRIEELRAHGTILRLLENQLIYPGGKLTARGIEEAQRLARRAEMLQFRRGGPEHGQNVSAPAPASHVDSPAPSHPQRPVKPAIETAYPASVKEVHPAAGSLESPDLKLDEPDKQHPKIITTNKSLEKAFAPQTPSENRATDSRTAAKHESAWDESAVDRNLVALIEPQSHEAEQFKILRTNILFPLAGSPPRSILVTSSAPGEGKTFAATNLAISIAINVNRHVLLVDADMRQPMVHKRFGFGAVPGLSNYLAEGAPLQHLLLKTKVERLTLLPAGFPPENPSELIGTERMQSLLSEITNRYPDRMVVIDSPPPGFAAETAVLARQVDGILVVVRYGKTRRRDLLDLVARMGAKKILGTLINYIETPASRYYGYKYGGYKRSPRA